MKYFYHDRNGELHGPAELDFLACEVKWGGLPDHLMIRPVDGEEWVALAEAVQAHRFKKGDLIALAGFGAGLTWASCIMKWAKED